MSGITPLLQMLKELEKRNIPGEFITNLRKIVESGVKRALLIFATGAHIILMTGRKALI